MPVGIVTTLASNFRPPDFFVGTVNAPDDQPDLRLDLSAQKGDLIDRHFKHSLKFRPGRYPPGGSRTRRPELRVVRPRRPITRDWRRQKNADLETQLVVQRSVETQIGRAAVSAEPERVRIAAEDRHGSIGAEPMRAEAPRVESRLVRDVIGAAASGEHSADLEGAECRPVIPLRHLEARPDAVGSPDPRRYRTLVVEHFRVEGQQRLG